MKALVLAAGKGSRLKEVHKNERNKCMTEVYGKPVVERVLQNIENVEGINEVVIVVGFRADDITEYFGNKYNSLTIKYAVQEEQRGVVNAIECAKEQLDGDDFLLHLGDEIFISPRHNEMIKHFYENEIFTLLGSIVVENTDKIKKTYTYDFDEDGNVCRMVEKPEKPFNNFMGTGSIVFRNEIFKYIENTPVHPVRREKELSGMIQLAINENRKVGDFEVAEYFVNMNTINELNEVQELALTK